MGGNIVNEPNNEVWTLSIEKSPFFWSKLELKDPPPARVYHAATIWKSNNKVDMVLIFGGRARNNDALKDLWGLRRNTQGEWDWVRAPNNSSSPDFSASERY